EHPLVEVEPAQLAIDEQARIEPLAGGGGDGDAGDGDGGTVEMRLCHVHDLTSHRAHAAAPGAGPARGGAAVAEEKRRMGPMAAPRPLRGTSPGDKTPEDPQVAGVQVLALHGPLGRFQDHRQTAEAGIIDDPPEGLQPHLPGPDPGVSVDAAAAFPEAVV